MILNQIMSEPKKNHAPQHQKLKKNKLTVSIKWVKNRSKQFCGASKMVSIMELVHC